MSTQDDESSTAEVLMRELKELLEEFAEESQTIVRDMSVVGEERSAAKRFFDGMVGVNLKIDLVARAYEAEGKDRRELAELIELRNRIMFMSRDGQGSAGARASDPVHDC
jgi:hypothetical protein